MSVSCKVNIPVSADQFIELLRTSSLAERRPIDNRACMEGMVRNSNLIITAWDGEELIGIVRSMTDFHYACYLSDLAVDRRYQGAGIGQTLQAMTQEQLGPNCKIIIIVSPAVHSYYEHMGFTHHPRCCVLERDQRISG